MQDLSIQHFRVQHKTAGRICGLEDHPSNWRDLLIVMGINRRVYMQLSTAMFLIFRNHTPPLEFLIVAAVAVELGARGVCWTKVYKSFSKLMKESR
jgi:hypothetical protein